MKKILFKAISLLLCLVFVAPSTYAITKKPCDVLVTESLQDGKTLWYPFSDVKYRVIRKKGEDGVDGTRVRSNAYLKKGDFAVGFDRSGAIKLYFGGREAILSRTVGLTFDVIPVEHQMDLDEHDVFIIYREIFGPSLKEIKRIFSDEDGQQTLQGYNCVDATCQIISREDGAEVAAKIFQPEGLFQYLIQKSIESPYYAPEVLVKEDIKTPQKFYYMLKNNKDKDGFSRFEDASRFVATALGYSSAVITAAGALAFFVFWITGVL